MYTPTMSKVYAAGLADERRVIRFLSQYYSKAVVKPAKSYDNIHLDVDCWVDDEPVSIKAEHAGARYKSIYFELAQCPRGTDSLEHTRARNLQLEDVERLLANRLWLPSWYYTGMASTYAILQKDNLRLYRKADIIAYVAANGWDYLRPLSKERRQYLVDSDYAYNDAICGYIPYYRVNHIELAIEPLVTAVAHSKPVRKFNPQRARQLPLVSL